MLGSFVDRLLAGAGLFADGPLVGAGEFRAAALLAANAAGLELEPAAFELEATGFELDAGALAEIDVLFRVSAAFAFAGAAAAGIGGTTIARLTAAASAAGVRASDPFRGVGRPFTGRFPAAFAPPLAEDRPRFAIDAHYAPPRPLLPSGGSRQPPPAISSKTLGSECYRMRQNDTPIRLLDGSNVTISRLSMSAAAILSNRGQERGWAWYARACSPPLIGSHSNRLKRGVTERTKKRKKEDRS